MRQYDINEIKRGVILFCRKAKYGESVTAESLGLSGRQTHLLKIVLTHKFSIEKGAPIDFPKLFICDDKNRGFYHKNTTPNDTDLSSLDTIFKITKLMTYVSGQERISQHEEKTDDAILDFSRPHTMEIVRTKGMDVTVIFHFL